MNTWQEFFEFVHNKVNPKDKNQTYLHGIIWGLDSPYTDPNNIVTISTDVDQTTYHALVLNVSSTVERFKTTNIQEAWEFFKKYNNI